MPSNHLILCRPLLFLPSIFPSIRVFSSESVLHIRWCKYWSFSFSISPSNEYSGLISFRTDWFDLLAVQGTLKSLLQHHSSKASVLGHSVFSMPSSMRSPDPQMELTPLMSPALAGGFFPTSVTWETPAIYQLISTIMAFIKKKKERKKEKKQKIQSVGRHIEKLETSSIAARNVEWCNYNGKHLINFQNSKDKFFI